MRRDRKLQLYSCNCSSLSVSERWVHPSALGCAVTQARKYTKAHEDRFTPWPQAVCLRQNHTFLQSPPDAVLPLTHPSADFSPVWESVAWLSSPESQTHVYIKEFFSDVASEIIKPGNFNSGSFQAMSQEHECEPCIFSETAFCFRISFTAIPSLSVFHRQHNSLEFSCSWQSCQALTPILPLTSLLLPGRHPPSGKLIYTTTNGFILSFFVANSFRVCKCILGPIA